MLLKYSGVNVRVLVVQGKDKKTGITAQYKHNLKPGINQVDADFWKEAQRNVTVKRLIKAGTLIELEEVAVEVDEKTGEETETLLSAKEAIAIVEGTVDVELLNSMLENYSGKASVVREINAKLDELKGPE